MRQLHIELEGIEPRLDPAHERWPEPAVRYATWQQQQPKNESAAAKLHVGSQHAADLAETAERFLERELGPSPSRRELMARVEKYAKELEEQRMTMERRQKDLDWARLRADDLGRLHSSLRLLVNDSKCKMSPSARARIRKLIKCRSV